MTWIARARGAFLVSALAFGPAAAGRLNVVLVSMDSVRADQVSAYGYPRETTPFLDRLSRDPRTVVFENASAPAPSCHPSHVAMLTGLYPQQVGIPYCGEDLLVSESDLADDVSLRDLEELQRDLEATPPPLLRKRMSAVSNWLRIPPDTPTLATFLHAKGYATGGFVSIWTLYGRFGYERGFDVYRDDLPEYYGPRNLAWLLRDTFESQKREHGEVRLAQALEWIGSLEPDRPFFLFLHFADTHVPYRSPDPSPFAGETDAERERLRAHILARYDERTGDRAMKRMSAGRSELLLDTYDRSIRHVDSLVGTLVRSLEERGMARNTLLVIAADHGDSFGQHLYLTGPRRGRLFFEHTAYLWEETQHVPLLLVDPGRTGGPVRRTVDVSLVDIVPTILARLGFSADDLGEGRLPGVDLLELPEAPRRVHFLTFGRGRPGILKDVALDFPNYIGFREGSVKFVVGKDRFRNAGSGRCFLYDLEKDPNEKANLCDDPARSERVGRYRAELVDWYRRSVTGREEIPSRRRSRTP